MKLEIKDLCVKVEDKVILEHFNFDVDEGEIHAVMGPNGVGKSTLSRVIMGDSNYQVVHGDILLDGGSILKKTVDERSRMGLFLAMQYPMEIEGVSNQDFLRTAMSQKNSQPVKLFDFIKQCESGMDELEMNKELIHRSLNVGFSGGEKKKNEVLQIKMLEPSIIILDEIDSGLDVDSLRVVCRNILDYKERHPHTAIIIITHYSMILDYIHPDFVHIVNNRRIVKKGDYRLVFDVEKNGYSKYSDNDGDRIGNYE